MDPFDLLKEVGLGDNIDDIVALTEADAREESSFSWKSNILMKGGLYRCCSKGEEFDFVLENLSHTPTFFHFSPDTLFGEQQYFVSSIDVVKSFIDKCPEGVYVLLPAEQIRDEAGGRLFDVLADFKRFVTSHSNDDLVVILIDTEESDSTHYPARSAIVQNTHQTLY